MIRFCLLVGFFAGLLPATVYSLDIEQSIAEQRHFRLLQLPRHSKRIVKWGKPVLGSSAVITYAFATEPVRKEFQFGMCQEFLPLSELANTGIGSEREVIAEIEAGLRMWETVAGVRFERVASAEKADVIIGATHSFNAPNYNFAGGVSLSHMKQPTPFVDTLTQAGMCFGTGGLLRLTQTHQTKDKSNVWLSLRLIAAHEAGHLLGLDHPDLIGALMYVGPKSNVFEITDRDAKGMRILYGPAE